jgi:ribosomal protein S18 acetylase RimI-like enzyme
MNTSLKVRRLALDQGPLLRELRIAGLREAPYAFGATLQDALSEDPAAFDQIAERLATAQDDACFVLYTEGQPAGLIDAYFEADAARRAFIRALWVAPAVRHLRGGELLVATASQWLAERGAAHIYAWVADANTNAMGFYERLGFSSSGDRQALQSNPQQWETLLVKHA